MATGSTIDFGPEHTSRTGVRASSIRSADTSPLPGCTPPMPPVAPTTIPARCAAQIVLETVVAPRSPEATAMGRSRRATLVARPGSANTRSSSAETRPPHRPRSRRSMRGRRRPNGSPRSSARRTRGCGAAGAPGRRRSSRARPRRRRPSARPRPRSKVGRRSAPPPPRGLLLLEGPWAFGPGLVARGDASARSARRGQRVAGRTSGDERRQEHAVERVPAPVGSFSTTASVALRITSPSHDISAPSSPCLTHTTWKRRESSSNAEAPRDP